MFTIRGYTFLLCMCAAMWFPVACPAEQTRPAETILVNHVGFQPEAAKVCVVRHPPKNEFTVHRLKDCNWEQVLQGNLVAGGPELESGSIGDFSAVREEGIYQVRCGARRSRCFVVWRQVYDVPMRVLYGYFPWQRCGDTLTGWAAPCHVDDGRIAETGEHRDFSGGYHQSCDLRKWASLEVLGLIGLTRFAQTQTPRWDDGCIAKELRWGGDYYHKLLRDDGGMFDSVFIPLGWDARDFYRSDAPPPAMWNTIRHQAMLAAHFRSTDAAYSETCKQSALRVWKYMTSAARPVGKYRAPALPPRGHDHLSDWYSGFYPGSALEIAHRLCAAVALGRIADDPALLEDAAHCASLLVELQATTPDANGDASGCFWDGPNRERLVVSDGYFWQASGPLGLCDILELRPSHADSAKWRRAIERIGQQYVRTARRNPWGLVATNWFLCDQAPKTPGKEQDEDAPVTETYNGGKVSCPHDGNPERFVAYQYRFAVYNGPVAAAGVFLERAAGILQKDEYRRVAQRQMDWILGCNPYDASTVEGVGYNQPHRGFYGEFFPPTPQIPGAVSTGLLAHSFDPAQYGWANEYDMPIVGAVLWLMTDISQAKQ
jgi:hypothetical protein